ncbi:MAG: hypothetical protein EXR72_25510 [Myxococcales bacterium]|nr:hypothetical protein [Myxococcales bacterium]
MSPRDASRTRIPNVPPGAGVNFRIASHAPLSEVYGPVDIQVLLAGLPGFRGVELFVDGARCGEPLVRIGGNRYAASLDTAQFPDGIHELALGAMDAHGDVLASIFTDLSFKNVDRLTLLSIEPNEGRDGYAIQVRLHTMRAKLPPSSFGCVDRVDGEVEELECDVEYPGEESTGASVALLHARRPRGRALALGLHLLAVTVRDNQGGTSARATGACRTG